MSRTMIALSLAAVWGCSSSTTSSDHGTVVNPGDDVGNENPDAGTGSVLGFTPSNGVASALVGVDVSALIDIDVAKAYDQLSVDCDSVGSGGCISTTVVQSDGSSIQVYVAKSWTVEPAGVLNVLDKTPVVLIATDTITVLGQIDAAATGATTVAGGFVGTAGGAGQGGPSVGRVENVDTGIAAGGGGYCGAGGASGKATAANGFAGMTYGTAAIVPLLGGAAGGTGSLAAGAGGGAVQLVAATSVTIGASGIISVGGGAGYDGTDDGAYVAGGGGSGGAVLIEAPTVTIAGTIEANGGGGGGGASGMLNAQNASLDATPAAGGQAGTTGAGGNGSAGATVNGSAGGVGDPLDGNFSPGAGGGGAGYIRVNTATGNAPLGGTLSPATGSTCVTQGTLAP